MFCLLSSILHATGLFHIDLPAKQNTMLALEVSGPYTLTNVFLSKNRTIPGVHMDAYNPWDDTIALIKMGKDGEKHALNTLFARYQERVLRIVRLRLNAGTRERLRVQSMDIVQDVFIKAFKGLSGFQPTSKGAFINWLSRIVENLIRDQLESALAGKRASTGECPLDGDTSTVSGDKPGDRLVSPWTSPTQHVLKGDIRAVVDDLLLQLDEPDQEVIIQHKLEELTFSEIGCYLGKSEDAVRKHFHRAFAKLVSIAKDNKALKELMS
jgi:RNA polymerase sigma-70 factor (subfamily 1)